MLGLFCCSFNMAGFWEYHFQMSQILIALCHGQSSCDGLIRFILSFFFFFSAGEMNLWCSRQLVLITPSLYAPVNYNGSSLITQFIKSKYRKVQIKKEIVLQTHLTGQTAKTHWLKPYIMENVSLYELESYMKGHLQSYLWQLWFDFHLFLVF